MQSMPNAGMPNAGMGRTRGTKPKMLGEADPMYSAFRHSTFGIDRPAPAAPLRRQCQMPECRMPSMPNAGMPNAGMGRTRGTKLKMLGQAMYSAFRPECRMPDKPDSRHQARVLGAGSPIHSGIPHFGIWH
jgi:hypothetical protein